ncbi:Ff.00g112000.m01.CDS01 [Fusarium sp. VM40]|nr:Ff.00g112000.m01.CDS01 [Fusarium sp. VM40]
MDPSNPNNNKASRVYDPVRDVFTTLETTKSINSVADRHNQINNQLDNQLDNVFNGPAFESFDPFYGGFGGYDGLDWYDELDGFDGLDGQLYPPVDNAFDGPVLNPANEPDNPIPDNSAQADAATNPTKKCTRCRNQTTNPKSCNECCAKMVAQRKAWISQGICSRCGKNPARQDANGERGKRCEECLAKRRAETADARERRNAAKALMELSRG